MQLMGGANSLMISMGQKPHCVVKVAGLGIWVQLSTTGQLTSELCPPRLRLHPRQRLQPVVSYSAGCDIPVESESATTGTKFDIAATDHIRPIATTTAIIHASICIPSASR